MDGRTPDLLFRGCMRRVHKNALFAAAGRASSPVPLGPYLVRVNNPGFSYEQASRSFRS